MSLQTKAELLVHFQLVQNIDLFHQAHITRRMQKQFANFFSKGKPAQPYILLEDLAQQQHFQCDTDLFVCGSKIDDCYYYSQAVAIRYEDERIELNEGCAFKMEFDTLGQDPEVHVLIEMLFFDLKRNELPVDQETLEQGQQKVSKSLIKLRDVLRFNQYFVPIEFDKMHCALLKSTLTTIPLDIKFNKEGPNDTMEKFILQYTDEGNYETKRHFMAKTVLFLDEAYNNFTKRYHAIVSQCLTDPSYQEEFLNIRNITKPKSVNKISVQSQPVTEVASLCNVIIKSIFETSQSFYLLWYKFIQVFRIIESSLVAQLQQEHRMREKQFWSQYIISSGMQVTDLASLKEKSIVKTQQEVTKQMRKESQTIKIDCEVDQQYCSTEMQPMVFRDVQIKPDRKFTLQRNKGLHLFVFVHGYKGGQYDLRLWKNAIRIKYADDQIVTYSPSCNAGIKSDDDIQELGTRMAKELLQWLKEEGPRGGFQKISFLAHSMGGLVVRAALPHLERYRDQMYTYMTLGTPHLGYLVKNRAALVNSGIRCNGTKGFWVIRKMHPSRSLSQLCLEDAPKLEDTFIFKLSFFPGMNWFKNLVFVSANHDEYVPSDISRIQRTNTLEADSSLGRMYNQIIDNIFKGLLTDRVSRIDVDFKIISKYQIKTKAGHGNQ